MYRNYTADVAFLLKFISIYFEKANKLHFLLYLFLFY